MAKRVCKVCTLPLKVKQEAELRHKRGQGATAILNYLKSQGHHDLTVNNWRYHAKSHLTPNLPENENHSQGESNQQVPQIKAAGASWELEADLRQVLIDQINELTLLAKEQPENMRLQEARIKASQALADLLKGKNFVGQIDQPEDDTDEL